MSRRRRAAASAIPSRMVRGQPSDHADCFRIRRVDCPAALCSNLRAGRRGDAVCRAVVAWSGRGPRRRHRKANRHEPGRLAAAGNDCPVHAEHCQSRRAAPAGEHRSDNRQPTSWLTAPRRVTSGRGQQRARSARNGRELVHTRPIPVQCLPDPVIVTTPTPVLPIWARISLSTISGYKCL
jgi:hypothetical protein